MAGRTLALRYGPLHCPITEKDLPGTWPDWWLTSSGIGHHYIPPGVFPPVTIEPWMAAPLPPAGQRDPRLPSLDEVLGRWETTSSAAYQLKALIGPHAQPRAPEPTDPTRTLGIKDLGEKLRRRGWRRPLTTANHSSETKAQYLSWPSLDDYEPVFVSPPGPELPGRLKGLPPEPQPPWTKKVELTGLPLIVLEPGILDRRQMYLTTSAKDFRYYSKKERSKYAIKNLLTNSQKILGWSQSQESLPQPSRVHVDCTVPLPSSVPYRELRSLSQESYKPPLHPLVSSDRFCPVETPWTLHRKPLPSIYSVPKAYRTESSRYGSWRAELV
ncbi:stabilizer of axonemal microtubules 3 [Dipodomys merriami]|uniref:stabilizer of axonemal microtubules 3 n=1 Tax=Dipodomys merriami TaxID=94247 RepID=UPI0038559E60